MKLFLTVAVLLALAVSTNATHSHADSQFAIILKPMHENILKAAAAEAGLASDDFQALLNGVRWNDVPDESSQLGQATRLNEIGRMAKLAMDMKLKDHSGDLSVGPLTLRSHYGDLQHWHSMRPCIYTNGHCAELTNAEVKKIILSQALEWWVAATSTQAKYADNLKAALETSKAKEFGLVHSPFAGIAEATENSPLFFLGNLSHMIQDSYSAAHCHRNAEGKVVYFADYEAQSSKMHAVADEPREVKLSPKIAYEHGWSSVTGAETAKDRLVTLYRMFLKYQRNEIMLEGAVHVSPLNAATAARQGLTVVDSVSEFLTFLDEVVYPLAAPHAMAGGSSPSYADVKGSMCPGATNLIRNLPKYLSTFDMLWGGEDMKAQINEQREKLGLAPVEKPGEDEGADWLDHISNAASSVWNFFGDDAEADKTSEEETYRHATTAHWKVLSSVTDTSLKLSCLKECTKVAGERRVDSACYAVVNGKKRIKCCVDVPAQKK